MNEKALLNNMALVDGVLSRCVNPALNRQEQAMVTNTMEIAIQRVKLSFVYEAEAAAKLAACEASDEVYEEPENEAVQ